MSYYGELDRSNAKDEAAKLPGRAGDTGLFCPPFFCGLTRSFIVEPLGKGRPGGVAK